MKKLIASLLALVLCFGLVACSTTDKNQSQGSASPSPSTSVSPSPFCR